MKIFENSVVARPEAIGFHSKRKIIHSTSTSFFVLSTIFLSANVVCVPALAVDAISTSTAPAADIGIGEIVVTSQKQRENLQRTPAAVTALSGIALQAAGVVDLPSLQALIPSVRFQDEGTTIEVYIRGVGSSEDTPQEDPPSSVNFNGVYIPREATSVGIYDVAQVEVLPGPQGTLYGRSTLGGTVNVNFVRPSQDREGSVLFETGNYGLVHTTITENIPLNEVLAVRAAVDYDRHNGYETSGAYAGDDTGGRLSALYTPNDQFTAYLWGAIANLGGSPPNLVTTGVTATGAIKPGSFLNSNPWDDQLPSSLLASAPAGQPQPEHYTNNNKTIGGQLDYRLGDGIALTYIPSYLTFLSNVPYWLGPTPADKYDRYEQTTHELRVSGDEGWLKWLGGLYGYRLVSHGSFHVGGLDPNSGFPVYLIDHNRIQGLAGFGQATATVYEGLRLTAGLRYSDDERTGTGRYATFPPPNFALTLAPYAFSKDYYHVNYKVGLDYDLTKSVLLYAAVQTGSQPGTYNAFASTPSLNNEVKPASLTAYTAGIKSRVLDDTLQINNEFFYYDYSNLFIGSYSTAAASSSTVTINANKVEIYGDQLDIRYKPTRDDKLNVSIGYTHARTIDFTALSGIKYDNYQLQYAPDWSINAGYSHDFQLGNESTVRIQASTQFSSAYYIDYSHVSGGRQSSYTKSDFSITYLPPSGTWSVGAWVKNVENQAVIGAAGATTQVPASTDGAVAFLEAPRTFGFRFTANY